MKKITFFTLILSTFLCMSCSTTSTDEFTQLGYEKLKGRVHHIIETTGNDSIIYEFDRDGKVIRHDSFYKGDLRAYYKYIYDSENKLMKRIDYNSKDEIEYTRDFSKKYDNIENYQDSIVYEYEQDDATCTRIEKFDKHGNIIYSETVCINTYETMWGHSSQYFYDRNNYLIKEITSGEEGFTTCKYTNDNNGNWTRAELTENEADTAYRIIERKITYFK